jgi:hypothetical protein
MPALLRASRFVAEYDDYIATWARDIEDSGPVLSAVADSNEPLRLPARLSRG